MIKTEALVKRFGDVTALNKLSCEIPQSSVYGLVGSNGAGKSTLLRLLAGIYQPTEGSCLYGGSPIFERPDVKRRIVLVPDTPTFLPQANLQEMADFYRRLYPTFSKTLFEKMQKVFPLDLDKRLRTFSKGMQRQAALTLALSCGPELLLLDEAFDGLDPVMRQLLKKVLSGELLDRGLTVVISSHNLRELEDFCDHVGLLHQGGLIFEQELDGLKLGLSRVQVAFTEKVTRQTLESWGLELLQYNERGTVLNLVAKGERERIVQCLKEKQPLLLDVLPLTLEEIFIQALEVKGYDVNSILE